jgi:hypothetical protein
MTEFNSWQIYLREGRAYFPTVVGQYRLKTIVEPVVITEGSDFPAVMDALRNQIAKGNAPRPEREEDIRGADFVMIRHAKVKSWKAFEKGLSCFSIVYRENKFRLETKVQGPTRAWVPDLARTKILPAETALEDVIRQAAEMIVALNAEVVAKNSS